MRVSMPLIVIDKSDLDIVSNSFSPMGRCIFYLHKNLPSLFNPVLAFSYIFQDWKTLLSIPPLIHQCSAISTKLILGLRFATIIPNTTYPFLAPKTFFKPELLSRFKLPGVEVQHLMIILLTSSRTVTRFDAARRSWVQSLSSIKSVDPEQQCLHTSLHCIEYFECCLHLPDGKSAKLIIVSDEADLERGIVTIPEIRGKVSYLDAQHRQLRMIIHLMTTNARLFLNIHWVALIDDDTWLNVNQTLSVLSILDWRKPVATGHILTEQESDKDLLYVSGGAGIFLSISAFSIIASKLYRSCPFCKYNDLTVGACLASSGIERVHVPSFLAFRPTELIPEILANVASIHYMSPQDMLNATTILKNMSRRI